MNNNYKSIANIFLSNIEYNYLLAKNNLSPNTECGAAVKANAYGVGVIPVVETLSKLGCNNFYVAYVDEALEIKNHTNANIYVLNNSTLEELEICAKNNFISCINSPKNLNDLKTLSSKHTNKFQQPYI